MLTLLPSSQRIEASMEDTLLAEVRRLQAIKEKLRDALQNLHNKVDDYNVGASTCFLSQRGHCESYHHAGLGIVHSSTCPLIIACKALEERP